MITATLATIAEYTEGRLASNPGDGAAAQSIAGVSTDTRSVREGNLFVPLIGEKFNGHAFVSDAMAKGASAFLWQADQGTPPAGLAVMVDNTLDALQRLASRYRATLPVRVVGITGSNGKTTTKDMTASVLSTTYRVYKTQGNLNNHIGLPLTLLSLSPETEFAVLEMGMSGRGEIERLTGIARPDAAVITNIGDAHLLQLGTRDEIAKAKLEIKSGLQEDGWLIVPGDEPLIDRYLEQAAGPQKLRMIRFGESESCDLRLAKVELTAENTAFAAAGSSASFTIPMLGKHNATNALAAIAVGRAFGIADDNIAEGLRSLRPTGMRIERVEGQNGSTLWNDAYNANPTSMKAALALLAETSGFRRKVAVLGDMLEMGPDEREFHRAIGREVSAAPIDVLFTYGELGREIAEAAAEAGGAGQVEAFDTKEELISRLERLAGPGDLILVKASRGMKMETIIEALREQP